MDNFKNTKLLIALMGLDIGGAETHVIALCKALKTYGMDIFVVSNGGVYESELDTFGIKHFKLPLHNKNLKNLITSYNSIKRIIIENNIRLVHAHARIPAFICGLLQRRLGFSFVTTAHAWFSTKLVYKILTNWGDATLAVAQDIKQNLIENYKLPSAAVNLTINGIDTSQFIKDTDTRNIQKEFGISKNEKVIVNISRLDRDMSLAAHKLIDIAKDLYNKDKNTKIIIIGGGNDYEHIKQKANNVNLELGINYIITTGTRTDIPSFLALAYIYIGVSRSALEAMACAKPTILAGNQGYIGILNTSNMQGAIDTNFCCRGYAQITSDSLKQDIFSLLNSDDTQLSQLSELGYKLVLKNYSIQKMAQDALNLYSSVRKPKKAIDALIVGYYGSNNHGDDALLQAIISDLKAHDDGLNIAVITRRPKHTSLIYNVNSIHKFNFFKIMQNLKNTNLLIMGGGSLIQDFTSTKSLIYYIFVINMAHRVRAKTMLYANGIGPLQRDKNKKRAVAALEKVEKITLRDNQSYFALQSLGLKNINIQVTADAAFSFCNIDSESSKGILDSIGLLGKDFFCLSLRGWRSLKEDFAYEIAVFCDYIYENFGLYPLFIPMQPQNDTEITLQVMELASVRGYFLEGSFSVLEVLSVISKSKFLLGMRLHSIIYSTLAATPMLGLAYDPKVMAMFKELNQPYYLSLEQVSAAKLIEFAEEVLQKREVVSLDLKACAADMTKLAQTNAQIAYDIINRDLF